MCVVVKPGERRLNHALDRLFATMVGLKRQEVNPLLHLYCLAALTLSMSLLTVLSLARSNDGTVSRPGLRTGRGFRFGERRVLIQAVSAIVASLHGLTNFGQRT